MVATRVGARFASGPFVTARPARADIPKDGPTHVRLRIAILTLAPVVYTALERLILPEDAALYIERARRESRVAP